MERAAEGNREGKMTSFHAKVEMQWLACFIAGGERYVLQLSGGVCDLVVQSVLLFRARVSWDGECETYMLAGFSVNNQDMPIVHNLHVKAYIVLFRHDTGIFSPFLYPSV